MDFVSFQIQKAKRELLLVGSYQWIYLTPKESPPHLEAWLAQRYPGYIFEVRRYRTHTMLMLGAVE